MTGGPAEDLWLCCQRQQKLSTNANIIGFAPKAQMGDASLVTKLRVESEFVEIVFGKVAASHFEFEQIQTGAKKKVFYWFPPHKTTVCFLVADHTVRCEIRVWPVLDGV